MKRKKLGEVLRERGHVSHAELTRAIEEQHGKLTHLGELMLERGLVSKRDLGAALTEVTHIPYVDCENVEIDPEILKVVPYATARRCCVLPLHSQGTKLVIAMAEPQNLHTIDELRFSTGMEIVPRIAFRNEILHKVDLAYGAVSEAEEAMAEAIVP